MLPCEAVQGLFTINNMENANINLAYFAGIMDGEGNIRIRHSYSVKDGQKWQIVIGVCNTNRKLIDWIVKNFGGRVYSRTRRINWKKSYEWELSCRKATIVLQLIEPYLLLKREQARLCIDMQNRLVVGKGKLSEEELILRSNMLKMIKSLNQKGVSV